MTPVKCFGGKRAEYLSTVAISEPIASTFVHRRRGDAFEPLCLPMFLTCLSASHGSHPRLVSEATVTMDSNVSIEGCTCNRDTIDGSTPYVVFVPRFAKGCLSSRSLEEEEQ